MAKLNVYECKDRGGCGRRWSAMSPQAARQATGRPVYCTCGKMAWWVGHDEEPAEHPQYSTMHTHQPTWGVYEVFGSEVDPTRDTLVREFGLDQQEECTNYARALNAASQGRYYCNTIWPQGRPDSIPSPHGQWAIIRHDKESGIQHEVRRESDQRRALDLCSELNTWALAGSSRYEYDVAEVPATD